jgi:DNA-binding MarR family transcriptional regulator
VQWDTLRHLHRHPDASLHDLAVLTFQTDQSFGSLATRMADRGLIERVPGPGRAVRHRLTKEGARLHAAGCDDEDHGSCRPRYPRGASLATAHGLLRRRTDPCSH